MTMRAVVLEGRERMTLTDVSRPTPANRDEVVVDVMQAAICSTDRKAYARGTPSPRILGHEFAGTLADGTSVGVHPEVSCGVCRHCVGGFENRCAQRQSIGLGREGGFADQVAVPRDRLLVLGPDMDPGLAPLLEPLACCVHAVEMLAPASGEEAMVVGAGAIGVLSMWVLQAAGCRVTIVQRSEERGRLARELGADAVVTPAHDFGAGPDPAPTIAVVSAPGTAALGYATEQVEPGARIHAMAGTPGGAGCDANLIHYRHLTVLGSTGSTFRDYSRGHELVTTGSVPLPRLPTHVIDLAQVPAAFDVGGTPGILKTLVQVGTT